MSFGQPVKGDTPWALYAVVALVVLVILFGIMNGRSESIKPFSVQDAAAAMNDEMKAIMPDLPR